eukprot:s856_g3.t1
MLSRVVASELVWVATLVLEPQAKRGLHLQWDLLRLIMPLLMHEVPELPELNQAALQGRLNSNKKLLRLEGWQTAGWQTAGLNGNKKLLKGCQKDLPSVWNVGRLANGRLERQEQAIDVALMPLPAELQAIDVALMPLPAKLGGPLEGMDRLKAGRLKAGKWPCERLERLKVGKRQA